MMADDAPKNEAATGDYVRRAGCFVVRDGDGICLFVREDDGERSHLLTIGQAQEAVADLLRSLMIARHRREQGEWPNDPDPCRHGTTLQGRIEHALFYAMRDEFGDDEMDEYVTSYAESILRELAMPNGREG